MHTFSSIHIRALQSVFPYSKMACCLCTGFLCLAGLALVGFLVKKFIFPKKARKSPLKEDWKKDVVYLYQFSRANYLPNLSPFCLKLETWLRMTGTKYENIFHDFTSSVKSKEGMMPFIEYNGVEHADSGFIIRDLMELQDREKELEGHLTPEQKGASRAFEQMVESTTMQSYGSIRYVEMVDIFLSEDVTGFKIPFFFKPLLPLIKLMMSRRGMSNAVCRHGRNDRISIGLDDLRAISTYLGNKPYMNGDKPTRVDAALFGMLAQILYVKPMRTPHQALMIGECVNLADYCNRIRDTFWGQDWPAKTR